MCPVPAVKSMYSENTTQAKEHLVKVSIYVTIVQNWIKR